MCVVPPSSTQNVFSSFWLSSSTNIGKHDIKTQAASTASASEYRKHQGLTCTLWGHSKIVMKSVDKYTRSRHLNKDSRTHQNHYRTFFKTLTERREPALARATVSFSFSDTLLCTAWKLFKAAEKSFIKRSFWSFCWRWRIGEKQTNGSNVYNSLTL